METFKWCVRPDFQIDNEPTVNTIEFGDGYTQRQLQGINSLLRSYSASVKVKNKDRLEVDEFFKRHKGIHPFLFKDPFTGKNVKVICSKWPAKMSLNFTEFTCSFVEVP